MSFDFNQFLVLAEELSHKTDEASLRTSISRAYYTVFHLGFARAEAKVGAYKNRKNRSESTHHWCWLQYTNTTDRKCRQLGIDGDRMKKRRHSADYDSPVLRNPAFEAERQIEAAKKFQADLSALDGRFPQP
jgi:uncharacterized protein (UPF0332 family)